MRRYARVRRGKGTAVIAVFQDEPDVCAGFVLNADGTFKERALQGRQRLTILATLASEVLVRGGSFEAVRA